MNNLIKVFITACLALGISLNASPHSLDKGHSEVSFSVKHLMITNVKGEFKEFDGVIDFDYKTKTFTRQFGKDQEDEVVEVTESLYDILGRYFIDNYKMPANYKSLQASAQGHAAHIASRFSDIAIKIQKNLTEDESKILFNMLEGDSNTYSIIHRPTRRTY